LRFDINCGTSAGRQCSIPWVLSLNRWWPCHASSGWVWHPRCTLHSGNIITQCTHRSTLHYCSIITKCTRREIVGWLLMHCSDVKDYRYAVYFLWTSSVMFSVRIDLCFVWHITLSKRLFYPKVIIVYFTASLSPSTY